MEKQSKVQVPVTSFKRFHHITFWVGNAKQAAVYYIARFGFKPVAYQGLETGNKKYASHVLQLGGIFIELQSPLEVDNQEFGDHIKLHGDGARDVAFEVEDCKKAYEAAVANGAKSVMKPTELKDKDGTVIVATLQTYGDTFHSLVQRDNYKGLFLPGYQLIEQDDVLNAKLPNTDLLLIDHVVGNQDWNGMENVCEWYIEKLGFHRFWSVDDTQLHTEYSALKSTVMTDKEENIKMPINEPAKGKKKSQIEEFVDFYGGPGVQHIALRTNDILKSVKALKDRGVEFLTIPKSYYDLLRKRLAKSSVKVKEDLDLIEKMGILVDFDEKGYLLQIFTKPQEDRPTLFYEIIQRFNNNGFGVGNFKALFVSIELEQAKRGNLVDSKIVC